MLSVDDNAMNLKVFRGLLKPTQMQITEAKSGQECLEILEKETFDIIFLDHMMPGMDGVETLHIMRERNLCKGVPVIMLTANALIGERERFLEEGFDDFLSKPIAPDKLEQMFLDYLPEELLHAPLQETEETEEQSLKALGIEEPEEFDFTYAMGVLGRADLLKQVLVEFRDSMKPLRQKLAGLFETIDTEEALHNYRIEVHALKSTSATAGAMLLSKLARLLELAAIEEDRSRLEALHPILMDEMQKHAERLEAILPGETGKEMKETIDGDYLDMLAVGLQNGDYHTADFLCGEIRKYRYPDKLQELVDLLAEKVLNLKAQEALLLITEIKGQ